MYALRSVTNNHACVKIEIGKYEISIAFDDSCGATYNLKRGDIRVFDNSEDAQENGEDDVTRQVFPTFEVVVANVENLQTAIAWCNKNQSAVNQTDNP
jgi:hypothetical protein